MISHSGEAALCLTTLLSNWVIKWEIKKNPLDYIYVCLPVTWKALWELAVAFVSLLNFCDPVLVLMQVNMYWVLCSCLKCPLSFLGVHVHARTHKTSSFRFMCPLGHVLYELYLTVHLHWRLPQWDSSCRFREDEAGQSIVHVGPLWSLRRLIRALAASTSQWSNSARVPHKYNKYPYGPLSVPSPPEY